MPRRRWTPVDRAHRAVHTPTTPAVFCVARAGGRSRGRGERVVARRIGVGVAGLGRLGQVHVNNLADRVPSAELVRVADAVEHSAAVDRGLQRGAVPDVPLTAPDDGDVDRQDERVVPGGPCSVDQAVDDTLALPQVELEPERAARGIRYLLERAAGRSRDAEDRPCRPRCPDGSELAVGVHEPGEAGRGEQHGERDALAEHRRRGLALRDVDEEPGLEHDTLEGGPFGMTFTLAH